MTFTWLPYSHCHIITPHSSIPIITSRGKDCPADLTPVYAQSTDEDTSYPYNFDMLVVYAYHEKLIIINLSSFKNLNQVSRFRYIKIAKIENNVYYLSVFQGFTDRFSD